MIEIKGLSKAFGSRIVTKDLNLSVGTGEFLAIIGRSGEGKSVLLKQIIGLLEPDNGEITINGLSLSSLHGREREKIFRECGYVFQFAALLDSLSVFDNVALYHLEHGIKADDIHSLVVEKIKSVGLNPDVLNKFPDELSGGMKKRVGLARTLMMTPKILIYDEPTTGLDPITTRLIHELMKETHIKFNTTTIVISHDVEVFKYASHVAMLHEGKIIFKGEASSIWDCQNPYIYQFIRGLAEGPITHGT